MAGYGPVHVETPTYTHSKNTPTLQLSGIDYYRDKVVDFEIRNNASYSITVKLEDINYNPNAWTDRGSSPRETTLYTNDMLRLTLREKRDSIRFISNSPSIDRSPTYEGGVRVFQSIPVRLDFFNHYVENRFIRFTYRNSTQFWTDLGPNTSAALMFSENNQLLVHTYEHPHYIGPQRGGGGYSDHPTILIPSKDGVEPPNTKPRPTGATGRNYDPFKYPGGG